MTHSHRQMRWRQLQLAASVGLLIGAAGAVVIGLLGGFAV